MDKPHRFNPKLTPAAKDLRHNMTKEERHLWYDFLRTYPIRFYRQKPIGPYIVDFYCPSAKLAIELDGSQHYDPESQAYDSERSAYLKQHFDIDTIRIPNNEVMQHFESVCTFIDSKIKAPLYQEGGGRVAAGGRKLP